MRSRFGTLSRSPGEYVSEARAAVVRAYPSARLEAVRGPTGWR